MTTRPDSVTADIARLDEVTSRIIDAGYGFEPEFYALVRVQHGLTSAYMDDNQRPTSTDIDRAIDNAELLLAHEVPVTSRD